ncbi:DMT family transporter [Jannaschia sp. KMU-145]|uniref:aromatic amino acid exporter YddG n=1 Tax=Jannaschia halovivens TaxID=3388667 RepID=UPI00396AFC05
MTRGIATALGFGAVLLWAVLALLTTQAQGIPPLQLLALCFAIGGGASLLLRPRAWRTWRQPWRVWALGVGGLFGYHLLYVLSLRMAPPVEASLIAYLWPLLIVLMSATVQRLRWFHIAGALLGLAGAVLVVSGGRFEVFAPSAGHGVALAAAFVWSGYSVLSRRVAEVPTEIVGGFCVAAAVLSALAHLALEAWVWPDAGGWLAIAGLGLGPLGAAFFLWDIGCKRGDLAVLGAASYAAPLLSTLVLVAAGLADASWVLGAACALITGGAVLAAQDLLRRG